jgi:hypothetical protein
MPRAFRKRAITPALDPAVKGGGLWLIADPGWKMGGKAGGTAGRDAE